MIDHVSIAVRDLQQSVKFYDALFAPVGYTKIKVKPASVGYGKTYPEFWINQRSDLTHLDADSGTHICVRVADEAAVQAFHAAALKAGGTSDGAPGLRPEYNERYYAAFIKDPDGNRIEAVTFIRQ
jgi:catechol 2,3-dioxygenase-like lactoylglutathione lyase family enzyme